MKGLTADAADPDLVAFEHALENDHVIDSVIDPMIDRVIDRLIERDRLPYVETSFVYIKFTVKRTSGRP